MGFRFHIDIEFPEGITQEEAIRLARSIEGNLLNARFHQNGKGPDLPVSYRLGNDSDRQKSNYLDRNKNGHCSTKKCVLKTHSWIDDLDKPGDPGWF